jgi:hypothetical protein
MHMLWQLLNDEFSRWLAKNLDQTLAKGTTTYAIDPHLLHAEIGLPCSFHSLVPVIPLL